MAYKTTFLDDQLVRAADLSNLSSTLCSPHAVAFEDNTDISAEALNGIVKSAVTPGVMLEVADGCRVELARQHEIVVHTGRAVFSNGAVLEITEQEKLTLPTAGPWEIYFYLDTAENEVKLTYSEQVPQQTETFFVLPLANVAPVVGLTDKRRETVCVHKNADWLPNRRYALKDVPIVLPAGNEVPPLSPLFPDISGYRYLFCRNSKDHRYGGLIDLDTYEVLVGYERQKDSFFRIDAKVDLYIYKSGGVPQWNAKHVDGLAIDLTVDFIFI